MDTFHDFPDAPFIVPVGYRWFSHRADLLGSWIPPEDRTINGFEPTTLSQKIRTVAGLHLDAIDSQGLDRFDAGRLPMNESSTRIPRLGERIGVPCATGWNFTIDLDDPDHRYGPILDETGWTYPDGTDVESARALLARDFDGEIRPIFQHRAIGSAFAPGLRDLLVRATVQRIREGFTGFWADGGVGIFISGKLDFSIWARAAFQDHLSSLPADRMAELGIGNPTSFDIRSYLEEANLTPDPDRDPRNDPVFREYLLLQHRGIKAFCESYREAVREEFPDRLANGDIKLWTNHFMGNFEAPQAPNVYVSDAFDIIHPELYPTVRPGVDFVYKLLRALGRFSKPVMAKGTLEQYHGPRKDGFDLSRPYRMLQRFLMAEAYANGAVMKPALTAGPIDESLTNWLQADGTVPEGLQSFADFVWAHQRFLSPAGVESDVRCAVVWSLPTRIWRYAPEWDIGGGGNTPLLDSFVGTTRILREAQIPYDVIVFGHSQLWDDTDQLARLDGYDALLLPGVESLSETQRTALQAYLADGGAVITSGEPPDRDEMYAPDDEVSAVFEHDAVTVLDADPGYDRAAHGRADGSLLDALRETDVDQVAVPKDPTLAINRLVQPRDERTIVHLLNYDYAPETDAFASKADIKLQLVAPDHDVGVARYFTPEEVHDLEVTQASDRIELTVPTLDEWGFVVLAATVADLLDGVSETTARERLEEAQRRVVNAREADRDWGPDFALATAKLAAGETAMGYDAYGQAETAARVALDALADTYPRPVVGIDLSHNQETWEPPSWMDIDGNTPFWWLESHFPEYRYEALTGWDDRAFEMVDVLLVPPTLDLHASAHGFEASELDRVDAFVANGGSIVIVGDGRAAEDIDELTTRFGFKFLGPPIRFPEGEWVMAPTAGRHPLVRDIDAISVADGTPIDRWPEGADILASIPEASEAWLSTDPPSSEGRDDEPSAAGAPILAHARHGAGHVVILGSPNFAFAPKHADPAMELVYNTLTLLGRESVQHRRGAATGTGPPSDTAPTPGSTPSEPSATRAVATGGQPGFSFAVTVLGGLAVVAGYLRRLAHD